MEKTVLASKIDLDFETENSLRKGGFLAYADEWFRENGVINAYTLNNTIAYLLSAYFGIKDVEIKIDIEKSKAFFVVYLDFWSFYFKKNKTIRELAKVLTYRFHTYEIEIYVKRYKQNTKFRSKKIKI